MYINMYVYSDAELNEVESSPDFLIDSPIMNDPLNQLHLTDRKMLESTVNIFSSSQVKNAGIPKYQRIAISGEEEASVSVVVLKLKINFITKKIIKH